MRPVSILLWSRTYTTPTTTRTTTNNRRRAPPRYPRNQANFATQSRKFKATKCWGCGQGHNLRDCPTTSEEEKQRIYQRKREEFEKNSTPRANAAQTRQGTRVQEVQELGTVDYVWKYTDPGLPKR